MAFVAHVRNPISVKPLSCGVYKGIDKQFITVKMQSTLMSGSSRGERKLLNERIENEQGQKSN